MFRNGEHSPLEYEHSGLDALPYKHQRVTEPLYTTRYSLEELQDLCNDGPIRTPFTCHTQAVERAVKLTSGASDCSFGWENTLFAALNTAQHRRENPGNVKRPRNE